jgi:hypothetical protein
VSDREESKSVETESQPEASPEGEAEPSGEPEAGDPSAPAGADGGEMGPAAASGDAASGDAAPGKAASKDGGGAQKGDRTTLVWIVAVCAIFCIELFFYGRRGDIELCVGKEGVHDFALRGQERTDDNRWKFPYCEHRVNLGLVSHFEELGQEALDQACRRATLMRFKDEQKACVRMEKNWKRQVYTEQIWPTDRRFYRRLFWLDR